MTCLDRAAGLIPAEITAWLDEFLYPAIKLAAIYERWDLPRSWIRTTRTGIHKRGDIGEEQRREFLQELELLGLYAAYSEQRSRSLSRKIDRVFSTLRRWKPWTIDFRWFFLIHEHRLKEFGDLVRSSSLCPIPRGTLEYAKRLLYLGFMFTDQGRTDRAVTVLKSSLREFERVSGVESLGQRAIALCFLARTRAQLGDFKQALELVKEGEVIGRRLRRPGFGLIRSQTYSFIYWRAGDYEEALRVNLEFCFANRRKGQRIAAPLAVAFLKAARFALLLDRADQARRLVSRAARLRSVMENRVVRGCLHLLRGDLDRESGTSSGFRMAAKHYDLAEANFSSLGGGVQTWLSLLSISRGALYLKKGRIEKALRQADLSMANGRRAGNLEMQEAGVLLKSFLLLEKEVPRYDIYESVLRNLGAVREPAYLFKVLANLYIYSWDLEDSLELTDLHLKQIEKLRERLSPSIYERLYRTYVTDRVLARLKGRFGVREEKDRKIVSF